MFCSIPSNIAEGSGKTTSKHFAEFLSISISSSYELETQLLNVKNRQNRNHPRTHKDLPNVKMQPIHPRPPIIEKNGQVITQKNFLDID